MPMLSLVIDLTVLESSPCWVITEMAAADLRKPCHGTSPKGTGRSTNTLVNSVMAQASASIGNAFPLLRFVDMRSHGSIH